MKVETLSKAAEQRIIAATGNAVDLVMGGMHPTDAVVKAAMEASLPKGHSRLVARAYNVARTNQQRETGDTILEKTAEFELADGDAAEERLFPSITKTAVACTEVSPEYFMPPVFLPPRESIDQIKAAAVTEPASPALPAFYNPKAASSRAEVVRRKYEDARMEASHAFDQLADGFDQLQQFFRFDKQSDYVDTNEHAWLIGNADAMLALALIRKNLPGPVKQASVSKSVHSQRQQQYVLLSNIKTAAKTWAEKLRALEERRGELPQILSKKEATRLVSESILGETKEAAGFAAGLLGSSAGSTAGNIAHDFASSSPWFNSDSAYTSAVDAIQDPEHEAQLKNVRTQAMLHGLMMHDPVIKGHAPQDVLNAFNEISETAPKLADHVLIMQPLLRKRLSQGVLDPFEVSQIMQMDRGIQSTAPRPASNSIL